MGKQLKTEMLSAELSTVCAYLFIMTPDTQPLSQSFNKHVNISNLTRSSRRTCQNMRIKPWLILPFIHLSSSDMTANAAALGSRKQMEPCPSSDQKEPGRQFRPFSASSEASTNTQPPSASASLCTVSRSAAKRGQGAGSRQRLFSGNLSLRN